MAMGHIAVEPVGHCSNAGASLAELGSKPCTSRLVDRCAGTVLSECGIRLHKLIEVFPGTTHVASPQALLRLRRRAGQTSNPSPSYRQADDLFACALHALSCILAPCSSCSLTPGISRGRRPSAGCRGSAADRQARTRSHLPWKDDSSRTQGSPVLTDAPRPRRRDESRPGANPALDRTRSRTDC